MDMQDRRRTGAGPTLVIALDGYEPSLALEMEAAGQLPALAKLRSRGACFTLDHGAAKRTGLASEHFSTGLDPDGAERWSAVNFDPRGYRVSQAPTRSSPFAAHMGCRTVVFDLGYFDLENTPKAQGTVAWGAHDPGVEPASRPASLAAEITERFGDYPAQRWIYGFVWPSVEDTEAMGRDLTRAVEVRAEAATWLLRDRLPDWDLGIVMVSEAHSAIEAMWHGIDPQHPLHTHPSAAPAGRGVREVYKAIDRLVEKLTAAFPEAQVVLFSMHGMGSNDSDAASMVLLPELLYRHSFGRPYMRPPGPELDDPKGALNAGQTWHGHMLRRVPPTRWSRLKTRLTGEKETNLGWMPATRYRPFWSRMKAFALPSFYDGRVRINLAGRESSGRVPLADYGAMCDEIEGLLRDSRDLATGRPIARLVERTHRAEPRELGPSEADIVVVWDNAPLGIAHPRLGQVGPTPYRRTGGHTGEHGLALFVGEGFQPGSTGELSAFDVAPTIIDMLGERPNIPLSGASALR